MKTLFLSLFASLSLLASPAFASDSPEKVAIEYVEALLDGDIDEMYDLVYVSEKSKATPKEIQAMLTLMSEGTRRKAAEFGVFKSAEVAELKYSNEAQDRAVVDLKLIFENKTKNNKLKLFKNSENEWKVKP